MSDLIERDKAIDAIKEHIKVIDGDNDALDYIATNMLKDVPSARPKGEWVWNENGMDWGIGCWCCSECGMRNPYIGSGDTVLLSNPHNWAGSKYCPNCGSDNREREGE